MGDTPHPIVFKLANLFTWKGVLCLVRSPDGSTVPLSDVLFPFSKIHIWPHYCTQVGERVNRVWLVNYGLRLFKIEILELGSNIEINVSETVPGQIEIPLLHVRLGGEELVQIAGREARIDVNQVLDKIAEVLQRGELIAEF
jgi:hypothetical protein